MKIVKIPEDYPDEEIEILSKTLRKENPQERIIFIRSNIDIIELSLEELYKVRDMIDKEISEREIQELYKEINRDRL